MKKIGRWLLATTPAMFLADIQTANASSPDLGGLFCRFFGWGCTPHGGGGPTSVPEPEMLALFGMGLIIATFVALHRYRRQR